MNSSGKRNQHGCVHSPYSRFNSVLWVKDVHCWLVLWSLNGIWWNLTELNALCQVFLAIRQHVLTSDWLRHFSTLDRRLKCTIVIMRCQDKSIRPFHIFDFSETLNGIWGNFTGSKKSLSNTNVCVFRANKKNYGCHGLWLAETFSTSLLQQTLLRYRADIIDLDIHLAIFLLNCFLS